MLELTKMITDSSKEQSRLTAVLCYCFAGCDLEVHIFTSIILWINCTVSVYNPFFIAPWIYLRIKSNGLIHLLDSLKLNCNEGTDYNKNPTLLIVLSNFGQNQPERERERIVIHTSVCYYNTINKKCTQLFEELFLDDFAMRLNLPMPYQLNTRVSVVMKNVCIFGILLSVKNCERKITSSTLKYCTLIQFSAMNFLNHQSPTNFIPI